MNNFWSKKDRLSGALTRIEVENKVRVGVGEGALKFRMFRQTIGDERII